MSKLKFNMSTKNKYISDNIISARLNTILNSIETNWGYTIYEKLVYNLIYKILFSEDTIDKSKLSINDNIDRLLLENEIKEPSIKISTTTENRFIEEETFYFEYKIVGIDFRLVYYNGNIVFAESTDKNYSKNLTDIFKSLLGNVNEQLRNYGLVEIRGTLTLKDKNYNELLNYCECCRTEIAGIILAIEDKDEFNKIRLLTPIFNEIYCDTLKFNDKVEELDFLESTLCYETLPRWNVDIDTKNEYEKIVDSSINDILSTFDENNLEGYSLDGILWYNNDKTIHSLYKIGIKGYDFNTYKLKDLYSKDINKQKLPYCIAIDNNENEIEINLYSIANMICTINDNKVRLIDDCIFLDNENKPRVLSYIGNILI